MVLHTTPPLRKSFIEILVNKYPKIGKKRFSTLATDRLEYLSNLVAESDKTATSEVHRVLGIKAVFNYSNDDRKYLYSDKDSIKTNFAEKFV